VKHCKATDQLLILDASFRFYTETSAVFDQYRILHDMDAPYITVEDTGKTFPTNELKVALLGSHPTLHKDLYDIYSDFQLHISPFSLRFTREFVESAHNDQLRHIRRIVDDNRNTLIKNIQGTSLTADNKSPTSVAWLRINEATASEIEKLLADQGVFVLPGNNFFWSDPNKGGHHIRVALTRDTDTLNEAAKIIGKTLGTETYHPSFKDEVEVAKRKEWHDATYQRLQGQREPFEVEVEGIKLAVTPGVFAPLWADSRLLAQAVKEEVKTGTTVLDMGTGTGVQAIVAGGKGAIVLAVDKSEAAVNCTKENITRNKLGTNVRVQSGDLFENVEGTFDIVIYNPPFRWFKPRDELEQSETDEGYQSLQRFFRLAASHLSENGKVLIVFSNSGDLAFFEQIMAKNGFAFEKKKEAKEDGWNYIVYAATCAKSQ
jgi:release factor glutamine methyltransferase